MITRRRFLAISAASLANPAYAEPVRWQGRAMGADVSLTLETDPVTARPVIENVQKVLRRCEQHFSLYDPASSLSRLNRDGQLTNPDPQFFTLLSRCGHIHRQTAGRFDPTVQPLWHALATGGDQEAARALIGWDRVHFTPRQIVLGKDQALTLNGVAQGFATDIVAHLLKDAGLHKVLVNIGEFHGAGRPWTLGVSDPEHGFVGTHTLQDRAIATSSPSAMRLGLDLHHILDPTGETKPRWSTVSVDAADATTADALSTALCFASASEIADILGALPATPIAICVEQDGSVRRISG